MSLQLSKKAYTKLIEENITELEKYMPEHSLEKKHTIKVLQWSIEALYKKGGILDREDRTKCLHLEEDRMHMLDDEPDQCTNCGKIFY